MNPWRMIFAVVIVALGSAAIWVWHEGSPQADATLVRAESPAPIQQLPFQAPAHAAVSEASPAPAPIPSPQAEPAPAASDGSQANASASVDPPNVDTPEPAQRKFARSGHADSDQN
jgi:hypothetical protein